MMTLSIALVIHKAMTVNILQLQMISTKAATFASDVERLDTGLPNARGSDHLEMNSSLTSPETIPLRVSGLTYSHLCLERRRYNNY